MNQKVGFTASLALAALCLFSSAYAQSAKPSPKETPQIAGADVAFPYQLFPTTNIWTQILLDTATGLVWQVQFSVASDTAPTGKWVINDSSLLPQGATPKNGRFTLSPTQNMYTFLLLGMV